jgi:hypothetical protein
LPVNTLMLNWFAVGQSAIVNVKLQSTLLLRIMCQLFVSVSV